MDDLPDLTAIPTITSFILRFIHEETVPPGEIALRGTIRCIQNNQEITFTRWEDAVEFINRFVPLATKREEE